MAIQIVMDQTGDTRHWFNPDDTAAVSKAEKRFKSLTADATQRPFATRPGKRL